MLEMPRGGTAAELLHDLAAKTVHAPDPPGAGRYHYVHTSGSYLRIVHRVGRKGEDRAITGDFEHMERQQWIAADGSGRLLVTQDGESIQPTGEYPPGRLTAAFVTVTDGVTAELRGRNPKGSTAGAMRMFSEIWNNQVVPPALQRLLLLDLAGYPELSVENVESDGARGSTVAVGLLDRERHTGFRLVFDDRTGALTGAEVTALDGAAVPVPTPATVSSTHWLLSGYATSITAPPR